MGSKVYDIVFSNAALRWIPGEENVFRNMFESLKVGGKIALNHLDHLPLFELDAYEDESRKRKANLPDVSVRIKGKDRAVLFVSLTML